MAAADVDAASRERASGLPRASPPAGQARRPTRRDSADSPAPCLAPALLFAATRSRTDLVAAREPAEAR